MSTHLGREARTKPLLCENRPFRMASANIKLSTHVYSFLEYKSPMWQWQINMLISLPYVTKTIACPQQKRAKQKGVNGQGS